MKKALKYIVEKTYKPILVKYLSKPRLYKYKGIKLIIHPEVFHPGFFFSTKLLLKYIAKQPLKQKSFLELGAGSGLISFFAFKQGAKVTTTDINPIAIEYLEKNSNPNHVQLQIIHSNIFDNIPTQAFDIIAINPPYYKRHPRSNADYAWYCGEKGEYFKKLFEQLASYYHSASIILMILSDDCDLQMIWNLANKKGFSLTCVYSKKNLLEKNSIFKIEIIHNKK